MKDTKITLLIITYTFHIREVRRFFVWKYDAASLFSLPAFPHFHFRLAAYETPIFF